MEDLLSARTLIGIKRMGEIDIKPFQIACDKKYPKEEGGVKAAVLCSKWQDELKKPEWHPFKIVTVNGNTQVNNDFRNLSDLSRL